MLPNTHNESSYERISIHEGLKFHHLAKRLQKIDTSEVIDIRSYDGEKWFVEITFKDNRKLLISNNLPNHFHYQVEPRGIPDDRNELFFGIVNP